MNDDNAAIANKSSGKASPLITRLNQYKEMVLLIVFFLGGLFWIFAYFATKTQLEELQCLTNLNISLIESRMHVKIFSDELNERAMELTDILAKGTLSEIEKARLIKTKRAIEELQGNLSRAQIKYDTSLEHIKSSSCEKGG